MNENCGCCEGTEKLTPIAIANRPGLSVLAYRVGTQASFLETMKARLSNLGIRKAELETPLDNPDEQDQVIYPLQRLATRSTNDPSIAMLDAWATVADVLTFYQERIANEGYLRTATERRSILELARLVGYTLRPGVSASVYLAYTLDDGADTTIPKGSRAQSLPDPGQQPQTFETFEDLHARSAWNSLKPRLTRPQQITQDNADIIDTLYFQGTATNLKPNDALLLVFETNTGTNTALPGQVLRFVKTVEPQNAESRTKVTLQVLLTVDSFQRAVQQTVEQYSHPEAFCVSSRDKLAIEVVDILNDLKSKVIKPPPSKTLPQILVDHLYGEQSTGQSGLKEKLEEAIQQQDALLVTWLDAMVADFEKILSWVPVGTAASKSNPGASAHTDQLEVLAVNPSLAGNSLNGSRSLVDLPALIAPLTKAVSLQPANSLRLEHNVGLEFASRSDINPQLLTVLNPALATTLYTALAHADVTAPPALESAQALRVKTTPFGSNAPLRPIYDKRGIFQNLFEEWPLAGAMSIAVTLTLSAPIGVPEGAPGPGISFVNSSIEILIQRGAEKWTGSKPKLTEGTNNIKLTSQDVTPVDAAATAGIDVDSTNLTMKYQVGEITHTMHLTSGKTTDGQDALDVQIDSGPKWEIPKDKPDLPPFKTNSHQADITFTGSTITIKDESIDQSMSKSKSNVLALSGEFDQIIPGSWVAVERPEERKIARVQRVQTVSRTDYGITATVTQLTLDQDWLEPTDQSLADIRGVTIYAQGEERELADEPIDPVKEAVCGDSIELDGLYDSLQPGRWLIVAGERTDIFGVTGVMDAELVMLSAIRQDVAPAQIQVSTVESQVASGNGQMVSGDGQMISGDGPVAGTEALKASPTGDGKTQSGSNPTKNLAGDKMHTFIKLANALSFSYKRDTVTIYGNVVLATHGETRSEVLGNGDGSKELQQFTLQKSPLTYLPAPTAEGATSTLQVRVNNIQWHETDSLVAQGPNDHTYTTQTDNDSKTSIIFGNGQHGARLPTGVENITALYRFGLGKAGNVKAQQINLLVSQPLGVKSVINPRPATGGADREDTDQARHNVPLGVMALDRLVSVQDYADFARTFAGIGKASAVRLSDGNRQLVHLTIAGADNIPIEASSDLYQNLFLALRQLGDPFEPLQVAFCEVLLLVISAQVRLQPDYVWESVEPKIGAALLDFFSFEHRELGQSVFLSEVISVIQSVAGVAYVEMQILDALDEGKVEDALKEKKTKRLPLKKKIPARLASIDRKAQDPAKRILPAQLAFLSPDVPETLFLKELTDEARN